MKIQLASDLHLEFLARNFPGERLVNTDTDADVLVLAGDIHSGSNMVPMFANIGKDVILVAGNHEAYGYDWEQVRRDIKAACIGTRIHFLDNTELVLDGVRFLGCTLWTDFKIDGRPQHQQMRDVGVCLRDFDLIKLNGQRFTPALALEEHEMSRRWLEKQLDKPFDGPTVVVTHHGPHPKSIHPRYAQERINGGFVSDLTPLVEKADLWLHGHVHDSFSYKVGKCRVEANPHGYVRNRSFARTPADFELENPHFKPDLVIEV